MGRETFAAAGSATPFEGVLRASWLYTGEKLVPGGGLRIRGGRIDAILEAGTPRAFTGAGDAALEFPSGLIHPGLVNAHTHLDLSGLTGNLSPGPSFPDWLLRVRALRLLRPASMLAEAARQGLGEMEASGTTAIADYSQGGASDAILESWPGRAVIFREMVGLEPARGAAALEAARAWLDGRPAAGEEAGRTLRGLAPHAPYSASAEVIRACRALAPGRPLSIHAAEDPSERRFLADGGGPLRDFLTGLGIDISGFRAPGLSPIAYLESLGFLGPDTLLVHAADLDDDDARRIASSGAAVVFCPGTHGYFHRGGHRLPELLSAGVPAGLGTDSSASSQSLSVAAEMRAARALFPGLDARALFSLGTGALLGRFFPGAGRLVAGAAADLAVADLRHAAGGADPLEGFLSADAPCLLTMAGGRLLHRRVPGGRWLGN